MEEVKATSQIQLAIQPGAGQRIASNAQQSGSFNGRSAKRLDCCDACVSFIFMAALGVEFVCFWFPLQNWIACSSNTNTTVYQCDPDTYQGTAMPATLFFGVALVVTTIAACICGLPSVRVICGKKREVVLPVAPNASAARA